MTKNSTDFIHIAVAVLITVLLVAAAFLVVKQGRDMFNTGTEQLSSTTREMSGGKYETYAGTTQTGSSVRRIINETFAEENVEVLVCTKDGFNLVYNGINYGATTAKVQSISTGMPATDAAGKTFDADKGGGGAVISGAGATLSQSGYNESADISAAGYISATANFTCSVQKDINGDIRRVTFVQK